MGLRSFFPFSKRACLLHRKGQHPGWPPGARQAADKLGIKHRRRQLAFGADIDVEQLRPEKEKDPEPGFLACELFSQADSALDKQRARVDDPEIDRVIGPGATDVAVHGNLHAAVAEPVPER